MARRKLKRRPRRKARKKRKSIFRGLVVSVVKWVVAPVVGIIALILLVVNSIPRAHVAVIPGHWGRDSGAICPDGLREVDINYQVAERLAKLLEEEGYSVSLVQELSPKLRGYRADLLVSIHSDSCVEESGFKFVVQGDEARRARLEECIRGNYPRITGLAFHPFTITPDMEEYYAFREIDPSTPAVIIEIGFMGGDRELLTRHPDVVAEAIAAAVRCFFEEPSPSAE